MSKIYDWQQPAWAQLASIRQQFPHALLLKGKAGIGKLNFAINLAKSLLCSQPDSQGFSCGTCQSCHWFEQQNHPDYRVLSPLSESSDEDAKPSKTAKKMQISVSQIRELSDFVSLSSHQNAAFRVALIYPAEALNQASANALLKVLEEPPEGMIFILVTHQPHRILPTIMSRCRKVDMPIPDQATALAWLQSQGIDHASEKLRYAGGAPLLLLDEQALVTLPTPQLQQLLKGGATIIADVLPGLVSMGMESALQALQKWSYDILCGKLVGEVRYHVEQFDALQQLAERVDLVRLMDFIRKLDQAKKLALHPLNNELQLETILFDYTQLFITKRT